VKAGRSGRGDASEELVERLLAVEARLCGLPPPAHGRDRHAAARELRALSKRATDAALERWIREVSERLLAGPR
jgi:hypothetical protein